MLSAEQRHERIEKIRRFPEQLERAVEGLTEEQLTTPYLAGEWSVAQNVHHLADSHLNAYVRSKLILTEDHPLLKPYNQDDWAAMPDGATAALEASLLILKGLHLRWTSLLEGVKESDWQRVGIHPERGEVTLERILEIYSGHGESHLDQIGRTLAARPR
jgi:hypothetical protein